MAVTIFDCLVVGAGSGGCLVAKKLAEAGFRVVLLECKAKKNIGHPWEVAIEKSVFGRIALKFPPHKMWEENPDISRYYADDIHTNVEMFGAFGDSFYVRHNRFNQLLLALAIKSGVEFIDRINVSELVIKDDWVTGVKAHKQTAFGSKLQLLNARMVVDASGVNSVLKKQVPAQFGIKWQLKNHDLAFGWNEVRNLNSSQLAEFKEKFEITPGMSYTRMGKYHAYEVLQLRRDNTVNLIFGTAVDQGVEKARAVCQEFIKANAFLGKRKYGGGGLIPIRRTIDSMVANGYLCLGDAACQVIPTIGSGVASSLHAADIAVRTITRAFNRGNFSRESLWAYNHKYQSKRGAILASYDIIRRFLQTLKLKEISEIFSAGLITDQNFLNTFSSKRIEYDVFNALDRLGKVLGHLNLLPVGIRFLQAVKDSQKAFSLYKKYPETYDSTKFATWKKQTDDLFSHYRTF